MRSLEQLVLRLGGRHSLGPTYSFYRGKHVYVAVFSVKNATFGCLGLQDALRQPLSLRTRRMSALFTVQRPAWIAQSNLYKPRKTAAQYQLRSFEPATYASSNNPNANDSAASWMASTASARQRRGTSPRMFKSVVICDAISRTCGRMSSSSGRWTSKATHQAVEYCPWKMPSRPGSNGRHSAASDFFDR